MQRQSIIVLINGPHVEAWGNLKRACNEHGFSYYAISQRKLPTEQDGWMIYRVPFNQKVK